MVWASFCAWVCDKFAITIWNTKLRVGDRFGVDRVAITVRLPTVKSVSRKWEGERVG